MAQKIDELYYTITIDGKVAVNEMKGIEKQVNKLKDRFVSLKNKVSNSFKAIGEKTKMVAMEIGKLGGGFVALTWGMGKLAKYYEQQIKAEIKLRQSLKATGEYTKELYNDWLNFASALQKETGIGDEVILNLMAMAKTMGVSSSQMKDVMKAVIDLSTAFDLDYKVALRGVVQLMNGQIGILGRYIPLLNKLKKEGMSGAEMFKYLQKQVEGQTKEFAKAMKGTIQLQAEIDDLKERIGKGLLPVFRNFLKVILEVVSVFAKLSDWFSGLSEKTQALISKMIAWGVVGKIVLKLTSILGGFSKVLKGIVYLVRVITLNPLIAGITALGGAVYTLYKALSGSKKKMGDTAWSLVHLTNAVNKAKKGTKEYAEAVKELNEFIEKEGEEAIKTAKAEIQSRIAILKAEKKQIDYSLKSAKQRMSVYEKVLKKQNEIREKIRSGKSAFEIGVEYATGRAFSQVREQEKFLKLYSELVEKVRAGGALTSADLLQFKGIKNKEKLKVGIYISAIGGEVSQKTLDNLRKSYEALKEKSKELGIELKPLKDTLKELNQTQRQNNAETKQTLNLYKEASNEIKKEKVSLDDLINLYEKVKETKKEANNPQNIKKLTMLENQIKDIITSEALKMIGITKEKFNQMEIDQKRTILLNAITNRLNKIKEITQKAYNQSRALSEVEEKKINQYKEEAKILGKILSETEKTKSLSSAFLNSFTNQISGSLGSIVEGIQTIKTAEGNTAEGTQAIANGWVAVLGAVSDVVREVYEGYKATGDWEQALQDTLKNLTSQIPVIGWMLSEAIDSIWETPTEKKEKLQKELNDIFDRYDTAMRKRLLETDKETEKIKVQIDFYKRELTIAESYQRKGLDTSKKQVELKEKIKNLEDQIIQAEIKEVELETRKVDLNNELNDVDKLKRKKKLYYDLYNHLKLIGASESELISIEEKIRDLNKQITEEKEKQIQKQKEQTNEIRRQIDLIKGSVQKKVDEAVKRKLDAIQNLINVGKINLKSKSDVENLIKLYGKLYEMGKRIGVSKNMLSLIKNKIAETTKALRTALDYGTETNKELFKELLGKYWTEDITSLMNETQKTKAELISDMIKEAKLFDEKTISNISYAIGQIQSGKISGLNNLVSQVVKNFNYPVMKETGLAGIISSFENRAIPQVNNITNNINLTIPSVEFVDEIKRILGKLNLGVE